MRGREGGKRLVSIQRTFLHEIQGEGGDRGEGEETCVDSEDLSTKMLSLVFQTKGEIVNVSGGGGGRERET